MSAKTVIDEVVTKLEAQKRSIRCNELAGLLEELGFQVKEGKRGGHRVVVHVGIPSFHSTSYNCGHGKNPEIKPAYINQIKKVIERYEAELVAYLEENNNG